MTCVGMSRRLWEKTGVGHTEGGPYLAVVTLDLERGLEVLNCLGKTTSVNVGARRRLIGK